MILSKDFDEGNELFESIEDSNLLKVKELLSVKDNQEIIRLFYGVDPLFLAVDCDVGGNNIEILRLLVDLGLNPQGKIYSTFHDSEKRKGYNLLHQFVITYSDNRSNGLPLPSLDLLHLLIDLKVGINCIDHIQMTPLDYAIAYVETEISEILAENGGKKNAT